MISSAFDPNSAHFMSFKSKKNPAMREVYFVNLGSVTPKTDKAKPLYYTCQLVFRKSLAQKHFP